MRRLVATWQNALLWVISQLFQSSTKQTKIDVGSDPANGWMMFMFQHSANFPCFPQHSYGIISCWLISLDMLKSLRGQRFQTLHNPGDPKTRKPKTLNRKTHLKSWKPKVKALRMANSFRVIYRFAILVFANKFLTPQCRKNLWHTGANIMMSYLYDLVWHI